MSRVPCHNGRLRFAFSEVALGADRRPSPLYAVYSSSAIANACRAVASEAGELLTPMKVQKLVYFAHGFHLGHGHGPMSSEQVQAWRWGPVFPSLYHAVKHWGMEPIGSTIMEFYQGDWCVPLLPEQGSYAERLIRSVWKSYGHLNGPELSTLTHQKNGPWYKAWTAAGGAMFTPIPNESIETYFKAKLDAARARRAKS